MPKPKIVPINKHLSLLGLKVRCRVSGLEGIVTSVCFDLYGCIQAIVDPGLDKEGKQKERAWLDISRLEIVSKNPVMEQPAFMWTPEDVSEGKKGPAEKPQRLHSLLDFNT